MQPTASHRFTYWDDSLLEGQLPKPRANRYLVFDTDLGGLNNIRIAFEYIVVLAAMTGRTLVIPPNSAWYLINKGPMPKEHKGGTTNFDTFYNLEALAHAIPVISTEEFISKAATHLDIPSEFQSHNTFIEGTNKTRQQWQDWLLENSVIPDWNPYDTVVCIPDIESAKSGPHMTDHYIDKRTPVEFSPWMNAAPVLYFPCSKRYRYLGPVATMLASTDDALPILARRFLKHHVRYRQEIFVLAEKIIAALGLDRYDALQVRRNDFQYKKSRPGTEQICQNISALFNANLPIYVASDETNDAIFDELAQGLKSPKVVRWKDVEAVITEPIPYAWIGPLEQLICTPARRFVGTNLSTFTSYIHRLRGYTAAVDQNLYFHNQTYTDTPEPTKLSDFRGRAYLREHPLFWQSC